MLLNPQWAFIELARNLEIQKTLRAELRKDFEARGDPTYDQLVNELVYLDAFTAELLRLHPAFPDVKRVVSSLVLLILLASWLIEILRHTKMIRSH
jgi:cytochrome P450